ncbi:hypothetical protein PoB_004674000 [Plakobranchus ocellatus]|uniref:Uncharacterized protein n=1 Tax=Plakobranchus ocellatus TaxID=259542 RepID=A0AAV4BME8_9GAST|nr:hypothetical protein PoB_004674000 [Plakobranchus ocellatus]
MHTQKMQSEGMVTSPQQGYLRLSGPPSGQGAGGGARTRDRRVPTDLSADSLATVPPTPPQARAPVAELESATEGSLQVSGRIRYRLRHQRPPSQLNSKETKNVRPHI